MSDDFKPLTGADEIAIACKWFRPDGSPDRDRVYREAAAKRLPVRRSEKSRILRSTVDAIRRAFEPAEDTAA
jgi:hypothetical protein